MEKIHNENIGTLAKPRTVGRNNLRGPLATKTTSESKVLGLNGNTFRVDGGKVSVFEERDEVSFRSLLKSHDSRRLEAKVGLEVLGDFPDETLEGQLPDEKFGRLLVTSDFTKGDGSGPEAMGFLDTTGGSCGGLASLLGGELLTGSLTTGGLASGLLGAGHVDTLEGDVELVVEGCC